MNMLTPVKLRDEASSFRDPFLEHRLQQEAQHLAQVASADDPIHSLVTVEFNITELCNRKCVFCPRVNPEVYPNRNLNMSIDVVRKVANDLKEAESAARLSFSGFGEALLHKEFEDILRTISQILPSNSLEANTNGDRLTTEKINSLFDAGLTSLYVNLYDGPHQVEHFN